MASSRSQEALALNCQVVCIGQDRNRRLLARRRGILKVPQRRLRVLGRASVFFTNRDAAIEEAETQKARALHFFRDRDGAEKHASAVGR